MSPFTPSRGGPPPPRNMPEYSSQQEGQRCGTLLYPLVGPETLLGNPLVLRPANLGMAVRLGQSYATLALPIRHHDDTFHSPLVARAAPDAKAVTLWAAAGRNRDNVTQKTQVGFKRERINNRVWPHHRVSKELGGFSICLSGVLQVRGESPKCVLRFLPIGLTHGNFLSVLYFSKHPVNRPLVRRPHPNVSQNIFAFFSRGLVFCVRCMFSERCRLKTFYLNISLSRTRKLPAPARRNMIRPPYSPPNCFLQKQLVLPSTPHIVLAFLICQDTSSSARISAIPSGQETFVSSSTGTCANRNFPRGGGRATTGSALVASIAQGALPSRKSSR